MKINVKGEIEEGGLSKTERLRLILTNVRKFYIEELISSKEKLANIEKVIKFAPNLNKMEDTDGK